MEMLRVVLNFIFNILLVKLSLQWKYSLHVKLFVNLGSLKNDYGGSGIRQPINEFST